LSFSKSLPADYVRFLIEDDLSVVEVAQMPLWRGTELDEGNQRFKKLKFVSLDTGFSLANFLLELHELTNLPKNMRKMNRNLRKLIREKNGGKKHDIPITVGDLVSSAWLELSYGVGAFIRDVVKLWRIFSNFNEKYQGFMSEMGRSKTAYHKEYESYPLPSNSTFTRLIEGVSCHFRVVWSYTKPAYTCVSADYRYWSSVMSQLSVRERKFFFALEKAGLTADPSIVWNDIPLSFLVDWVYPVGEWLHERRISLVDMNITIDAVAFGAAYSLTRDVYMEQVPGVNTQLVSSERWFVKDRALLPLQEIETKTLEFGKMELRKVLSGTSLLFQAYLRGRNKR